MTFSFRRPREGYRRSLRAKSRATSREERARKREGEVMKIASKSLITTSPTVPIYDVIKIMSKEGFRRVPTVDSGTRRLEGLVTSTDLIDYLGGGEKFQLIRKKSAGNFFKAINEPVRIIMERDLLMIDERSDLGETLELMLEYGVGGIPIVDDKNRIVAMITERDIMNHFIDKIMGVKVEELMTREVVSINAETTIIDAERIMIEQGFRRLPIVSEEEIIAVVTAMDIIRFFGSKRVFQHLQSGMITQVLESPIIEISSKEIIDIHPQEDVSQAANLMRKQSVGGLPVVEGKKLVGMITERDFLKLLKKEF